MAKISCTSLVSSKYTYLIINVITVQFPNYCPSQTDQSATFCEDLLTHPMSLSLCLSLSFTLSLFYLGQNMSSPGRETWGFKFHNSPASPIIRCVCMCVCVHALTLSHFISCLGFSGLHTAEKGLYYDYHSQCYSEIIIWFHTHTLHTPTHIQYPHTRHPRAHISVHSSKCTQPHEITYCIVHAQTTELQ